MSQSAESSTTLTNSGEEEKLSSEKLVSLQDVMESVVRITLAGLGGSVLGLSQERKLESMRLVTGPAATAAARRKRVAVSTNVPLQWAISCMAFCTLIETSRRVSPTRRLLRIVDVDLVDTSVYNTTPATTVSDYTLGGAVGGLAASMGRQRHLRLPPSIMRGSKRYFGVVPGLALGFAAGVCQAITDGSIFYLEQRLEESSEQASKTIQSSEPNSQ